jgi:hypothetical protein
VAGYSAWVVDFHLAHLSAGKKDDDFARMQDAFRAKWQRALAPRWLQTTCSLVHLSGAPIDQLAGRIAEVPVAKITRRLPGAHAWGRRPKGASGETT